GSPTWPTRPGSASTPPLDLGGLPGWLSTVLLVARRGVLGLEALAADPAGDRPGSVLVGPDPDPHRVWVDEPGRPGLLDQVDTLARDDLGHSPLLVLVVGDPFGVGKGGGDVHLRGVAPQAELPPGAGVTDQPSGAGQGVDRGRPLVQAGSATRLASISVTSAPSSWACSAAVALEGPPPSTSSRITAHCAAMGAHGHHPEPVKRP